MADHKSALKRHRQSVKRTERNKQFSTAVKSALKKALTAVHKRTAGAETAVREAVSTICKVKAKGTIPANRAGRLVSRIARAANAAKKPKA